MGASADMRLIVAGGEITRLEPVAERCGVVIGAATSRSAADDPGSRLLLAALNDSALLDDDLWCPPYFAWIRADGLEADALIALVGRAASCDLFCSLTTATATELNIAGRLSVAVADRHAISETTREDLELALHEAISNGLVHGNLGVGSIKGLSIGDLDQYSQNISDRLADPRLRDRRIEVSAVFDDQGVTIDVRDEGAGYETSEVQATDGVCGRGLDLIAGIATSCQVRDGGRRITMSFSL